MTVLKIEDTKKTGNILGINWNKINIDEFINIKIVLYER